MEDNNQTTDMIIDVIDQFESADKSFFIKDVLNALTEDQRGHILWSLLNNKPITKFK